jgi:hypothetical protein
MANYPQYQHEFPSSLAGPISPSPLQLNNTLFNSFFIILLQTISTSSLTKPARLSTNSVKAKNPMLYIRPAARHPPVSQGYLINGYSLLHAITRTLDRAPLQE